MRVSSLSNVLFAGFIIALISLPLLEAKENQSSQPIRFRLHTLNPESAFSAAGVLDVNEDGKVDIVSGAWWYEAPRWKKHQFRQVQEINGRFDDYSNIVVDVDGDGRRDIVSVNYRSQSLNWSRNPGFDREKTSDQQPSSTAVTFWQQFEIDRPGKSETGRLVDIDGDGQLDILPAGTDFAAWYEFKRTTNGVQWQKHLLPDELIGHGIGAGDIDGDGRLDLVGPQGWAAAPQDPRTSRWVWNPDFQLASDCGLPILCWDVDGDGDNDLVWGRGHNIGIYWTEQKRAGQLSLRMDESVDGEHPALQPITTTSWETHAIDTSWGSAHTLIKADIDSDGRDDLVIGKRFQGHDGRDKGENDPLAVYWYRFDPDARTWQRQTASSGGRCGIDLDTVCADLDGDGDADIVAPSRAGLFWLENLRITDQGSNPVREHEVSAISGNISNHYADNRDLSYLVDESGQRHPIVTALDHGVRRRHAIEQMQQVMGTVPEPVDRIPLDVHVRSIEQAEGYWRLHLSYAADRWQGVVDRVTAYLLIPFDVERPAPAMLCLHQTHFELGKGEPVGLGGNPNLHFAHELAKLGYVCIAPDYPGFSEYSYSFEEHSQQYSSGTMKGIWNHIRAVDLLESLPIVKRNSIGVIGHSLGGHNALFVAAMDQRLSCAVTSCGFNSFEDYYEGNLTGWSSSRYMPKIATTYENSPKHMPFDFMQVLAAIAPRPVFVNAPIHDSNFEVAGVQKCENAVRPLYELLKADKQLVFVYPDAGHDFPQSQRQQAYEWLRQVLK